MPPRARPTGGIITSFVREVTTVPNAMPMMMPTAIPRTFPLEMNSRNSVMSLGFFTVSFLPSSAIEVPRASSGLGFYINSGGGRRKR